jgi:dephospho-CoA kinase
MLKIGLTGGMGSGKSTVAKVFETLGIPVYYADDAAKELMNTDEGLKQQIKKYFGNDCYTDGKLNRKHLAAIVFNNPEQLALLNSIIHPATITDANKWIAKQKSPYIIKEAALLFESGSNKGLNYVIGVAAPLALRIKRIKKRDGITEEEAMLRINRQMDEEKKIKLCDLIISNNEHEMVIPQVLELDKKLRELSDNGQ